MIIWRQFRFESCFVSRISGGRSVFVGSAPYLMVTNCLSSVCRVVVVLWSSAAFQLYLMPGLSCCICVLHFVDSNHQR
jgi:hypothetical protein